MSLEVAKRDSGLQMQQWPDKRTEMFEGTVSEEGFDINRILRYYRNSFLPVIHGRFSPLGQGVRIEVTMTFHIVVWALCLFGLSFVAPIAVIVVPQILTTGRAGFPDTFGSAIYPALFIPNSDDQLRDRGEYGE